MVSATDTMFQVDCDYQNECSGANLRLQRNSRAHFSATQKNTLVKMFTDIQNIQYSVKKDEFQQNIYK